MNLRLAAALSATLLLTGCAMPDWQSLVEFPGDHDADNDAQAEAMVVPPEPPAAAPPRTAAAPALVMPTNPPAAPPRTAAAPAPAMPTNPPAMVAQAAPPRPSALAAGTQPMPVSAPAGPPDPFCASVAQQDGDSNDFDAATKQRMALHSYLQCMALFHGS